jgi:hypothetical protein
VIGSDECARNRPCVPSFWGVLRLRLERDLRSELAAAWTLLAEPAEMNRWSSARIESIAPGDGGHPCGVGALRRIHLPFRAGVLTEVIEREDAPHRIEYRVIAGAPVRSHRGTIELSAVPHGTRVVWTVEIDPVVRALNPVMRGFLRRELTTSLDRLVMVAQTTVLAGEHPPQRAIDRGFDLGQLRRAAGEIAVHQANLAAELEGRDDPRHFFARVYRFVTEGLLAAVDAGTFDHPAWVMRLLPVFDAYFTANVRAAPGHVEPHWARAFAHIEKVRRGGATNFELAMHSVYVGMRAHIEEDLPRTLARVYADHYATACDHVRFRADYLRMHGVFTGAGDRLMADLPRREWTPRARFVDAITPVVMRDRLIDRHFYPITRQRARAFERAGMLAAMLIERR